VGKISETIFTAKVMDFSILKPPSHLRVTQSFLTVANNPVDRTKETNGGLRARQRSTAKKARKNLLFSSTLTMTGRPKRLKTERESGFKAHPPSLKKPALDPQAYGFAAVASDPSHKPFGYAAAQRVPDRPPAAVCWQDRDW
jgi:hypothetical protein